MRGRTAATALLMVLLVAACLPLSSCFFLWPVINRAQLLVRSTSPLPAQSDHPPSFRDSTIEIPSYYQCCSPQHDSPPAHSSSHLTPIPSRHPAGHTEIDRSTGPGLTRAIAELYINHIGHGGRGH